MVREAYYSSGLKNELHWVRHRVSGMFIANDKHLLKCLPNTLGARVTEVLLSGRIHKGDVSLHIGGDYSVADAGKRDLEELALLG